jgi:hypothetical protein
MAAMGRGAIAEGAVVGRSEPLAGHNIAKDTNSRLTMVRFERLSMLSSTMTMICPPKADMETCRTRIINQIPDSENDAILVFAIDFGKLFLSGAQDVDSIIHSLHPS